MTTTTTKTWDQFLTDRFTDQSEINDVAKYGCDTGISGFIYSSELYDLFDEYEEEIWQVLDDADVFFSDFIKDQDRWSMQEIKEKVVWCAVELWCNNHSNN